MQRSAVTLLAQEGGYTFDLSSAVFEGYGQQAGSLYLKIRSSTYISVCRRRS